MREVLEIRRDDRENCKALYFMMFAIGLLLLVRDAFGVSINKYIILAVVAVATFAFPIEKVVYFIAFLTLIFWAPKSLQMVIAAVKLKMLTPWKKG